MNFKTLIGKNLPEIKKLLFMDGEEGAPAHVDSKLADGSIIRVEPLLEVGAKVSLISEDGSTVEVPDAEHELEDGTVIRTEAGMIVEITEAPEAEAAPESAPEAPASEDMETAKTADGETVLNADPSFSVGAMVTVAVEGGDAAPAPDGSYELEDGRVCVVEAGVITEITEAPAAEAAPEVSEEAMRVAMAKYSKKMGFATSREMNERFSEVEKGISLLTEIVEKLSALPKEDATKPVANPFNRGNSQDDLVEKMRKALNN